MQSSSIIESLQELLAIDDQEIPNWARSSRAALEGVVSTSEDFQNRLKRICFPRLALRYSAVNDAIEENIRSSEYKWKTILPSLNQIILSSDAKKSTLGQEVDEEVKEYVEMIIHANDGMLIIHH